MAISSHVDTHFLTCFGNGMSTHSVINEFNWISFSLLLLFDNSSWQKKINFISLISLFRKRLQDSIQFVALRSQIVNFPMIRHLHFILFDFYNSIMRILNSRLVALTFKAIDQNWMARAFHPNVNREYNLCLFHGLIKSISHDRKWRRRCTTLNRYVQFISEIIDNCWFELELFDKRLHCNYARVISVEHQS